MVEISVKTFEEEDLDGFLEMSQLEYGASVSSHAGHIRWKHLNSQFGKSLYVNLSEAGQVVGRALIHPRKLHTASKVFDGAQVMDLLINKTHRSRPGNFINLTKECGNIENFDLVFHTSNENSFPLYSRLFQFPSPFSLRSYAFPVRVAGFLSLVTGRRIKIIDWITAPFRWLLWLIAYLFESLVGLDVSQRGMGDAELETLCAKCVSKSGPQLARTNDFLKWRFTDSPLWPALIFRVERKGMFLGYVVTREVELDGLKHLVLMDFVLDPDASFVAQLGLRLWLVRKAISMNVDALFAMANPSSHMARKVVGFPLVAVPDRFLPHATPVFVRSNNDESKWLTDEQSTHITLADLDYF
ncbi:hypothetical protein [Mariprofundus ferrooxydans]|uniref:hypothetical protein n=1 Tax=Mariprofundus ferrooxydans TaxID=314344 RepID=UPI00036731F8|nr:hypothetical protein [Mariprofundus ferrooxydans]